MAAMPEHTPPVNLDSALDSIDELWSPRVVAQLNAQHIRIAKIKGEFVWHEHEHEDEAFLVLRGSFRMDLQDRSIELNKGDLFVVPRGTRHRPIADTECCILLFEPAETINTGNTQDPRTQARPKPL